MSTVLSIDPVTRIEGHAKILLDLGPGGEVQGGHLEVLEIRGFEKLVERMELARMPQVTGRICGVCPAAHHLASVIALERGAGVEPPPGATLAREILYVGHLLHSHALSTFVLVGPDVALGVDADPAQRNVFGLLKVYPEVAKKALSLRSIGQRVVETLGGRGVHPVAAVPGGMASLPTEDQWRQLASWGREAVALVEELADVVVSKLDLLREAASASQLGMASLALSRNGTPGFLGGEAVVVDGSGAVIRRFQVDEYASHLEEHVMPKSYMKSVLLRGTPALPFMVGPLARLNVSKNLGTPRADELAQRFKERWGVAGSPLAYLEARVVEMVYCAERLASLSQVDLPQGPARVPVELGEGRYVAAIEAPRGLLVHDYTADDHARVVHANFIVATQNNYHAIDAAIKALAGHFRPKGDQALMNGVEFALRCFDPCLSCATHAAGQMPLLIVERQGGEVVRVLRR